MMVGWHSSLPTTSTWGATEFFSTQKALQDQGYIDRSHTDLTDLTPVREAETAASMNGGSSACPGEATGPAKSGGWSHSEHTPDIAIHTQRVYDLLSIYGHALRGFTDRA
jgi:hypothetical protein